MSTAPIVSESPFPVPAKSARISILGEETDITHIAFTDKILFTISSTGSLAHWTHVPLAAPIDTLNSTRIDSHDTDNALLPLTNLTATTILGGTRSDDEIFGQTLATTIGSAILLQRPDESRTLVLGLGINTKDFSKAGFDELAGAMLDLL